MSAPFDAFFKTATGGNAPYDYQHRLAGGDAGTPCTPLKRANVGWR